MTREQAARVIDSLDFYMQSRANDYGERSHEAMMMAIESLKNENALLDRVLEIIGRKIGENRGQPETPNDYVIACVDIQNEVLALKGGEQK